MYPASSKKIILNLLVILFALIFLYCIFQYTQVQNIEAFHTAKCSKAGSDS